MRVHKFVNDPQELLKQGEEIVKSRPEGQYYNRVVCVNVLLTGNMDTKELSKASGIPVRTLQSWIKNVDEKGWDSLKDPRHPGRQSRLTPEQKQEIKQLVIDDNPQAFGYYVWDTKSVAEHIRNTYGIEYGQSATNKLMNALGLALVRPTTLPSLENPNPEAEEDFKKNSRRRWTILT